MGFLDPNSWANALSDDPTGSKAAANTQAQWEQRAIDLQQKQYDDTIARMQPWVDSGTKAINTLSGMTQTGGTFDPTKMYGMSDFQNSPLYQSMIAANQQGAQGISARAAATGMLGSGNMQNQLMQNAQQNALAYEPQSYNQWSNNRANNYNFLAGLANPNAAQQVSNIGVQTGQNIASSLSGIGTNFGNAMMANNAAASSGWGNLSSSLGQGVGNWLMSDSGNGQSNAAAAWGAVSDWMAGSEAGAGASGMSADWTASFAW